MQMKDFIKEYLKEHYNVATVSDKTLNLLLEILSFQQYPRKHAVVPFGEPTSKFYILQEGIVGSYVRNKENNNFIRTLYTKGRAFGSLSSLIQRNIVSNASYICLTDCSVLEANFKDFNEIKEYNKEFELIYCSVLEETYIRTEKKFDDVCTLTAKERYIKLNKQIPNISNLLPQYQIANFLNVTPVQLSRIRKQLLRE